MGRDSKTRSRGEIPNICIMDEKSGPENPMDLKEEFQPLEEPSSPEDSV